MELNCDSTKLIALMGNSEHVEDGDTFVQKVLGAKNNSPHTEDNESSTLQEDVACELFDLYVSVRKFDDSYSEIHMPIASIIAGTFNIWGIDAAYTQYYDIRTDLLITLH